MQWVRFFLGMSLLSVGLAGSGCGKVAGGGSSTAQCRSACKKLWECVWTDDPYTSGSPESRVDECVEGCVESLTSSNPSGPYGYDERAETRDMVNCIQRASCASLMDDCYERSVGSQQGS